jgi:hypothetical protein
MQMPVDQQPWADDMEVNGVLGEIDADVLFVPAKRGFMGLEGIDGKTADHAFGKQSRSGARAGSDDVNSFHPVGSRVCERSSRRREGRSLRQHVVGCLGKEGGTSLGEARMSVDRR